MRKFRVKIRGDAWVVYLLNYLDFAKKFPGAGGITVYNHSRGLRELYFSSDCITRGYVAHEVLHAYFSYCDFSNKSYATMEELICEYLDDRLPNISKVIDNIYHKLKRLK